MDLLICEAPLDNSFQKDRLELVSKGSLGRRRKPSRSNLKAFLSPSNNFIHSTSSSSDSSKKETLVNGDICKKELSPKNCKLQRPSESSLPRTSSEPNHASEAKPNQLKTKRKNSDLGRSAVLIQTWERRTQWDSFYKQQQASKTNARNSTSNRFQNKENQPHADSAMPDSYICPKYKGSLQNGESVKKVGLVPNVRETSATDVMLYRLAEDGCKPTKQLKSVNGGKKESEQEPEWISLSKKLCAKFVEGHIEPHSTDSYRHEEPEGVQSTKKSSPPMEKRPSPQLECREEKIKKVLEVAVPENQNGGPPWIHLSRKLCTKFIEEHIEYPPIHCDETEILSQFVEPNGDIRIIEKIGKPKSRKSKSKKESEPEWISLSRKLRAKFIESHIDDPDTISLDNQLNASDPEETSSESLSDTSQEIIVKKTNNLPDATDYKGYQSNYKEIKENRFTSENNAQNENKNSVLFPEKECCWEYQEMEFDQESNSGTFQETEIYNGTSLDENDNPVFEEIEICKRSTLTESSSSFQRNGKDFANFTSFAEIENMKNLSAFQDVECLNNDVHFPDPFNQNAETSYNNFEKKDKHITVQFIAHPNKHLKRTQEPEIQPSSNATREDITGSYFNLSTWEEAHKANDAETGGNTISSLYSTLRKDFKSKSMDNVCEPKLERHFVKGDDYARNINQSEEENDISALKRKNICKSEEMLHKACNENLSQHEINNFCAPSIFIDTDKEIEMQSFLDRKNENSSQASLDFPNEATVYGKISRNISASDSRENRSVKQVSVRTENKETKCEPKYKCNGVIPNSKCNEVRSKQLSPDQVCKNQSKCRKEGKPQTSKLGMSKWINISKSEQSLCRKECANLKDEKRSKIGIRSSDNLHKHDRVEENVFDETSYEYTPNCEKEQNQGVSSQTKTVSSSSSTEEDTAGSKECNTSFEEEKMKMKSKSLCDVSDTKCFKSESKGSTKRDWIHRPSTPSPFRVINATDMSKVEFQDFEFGSEIPLCAKLVSKQNKKNSTRSVPSLSSSSNRNESPCSETSHVYEDMFKETTSCPSDSETSSWTVMKNNTYYVNGRSSSMNDLDFSDSCSLSVKCDYASSCSDRSTLQSRHSSCGSSSFYVNLRDYDSHMLEPKLTQKKCENRKISSNDNSTDLAKNSPPTPESLRHLFTSPLSSIHSPPNRNSRIATRIPHDQQSHYYSTAAATSSAFKHGFDLQPPKQKKAERSSSIKIKDIAHGIILTFRRFQNHSKNCHVSPTHYVDVSHLAELGSKSGNGVESGKSKSKKGQKEQENGRWRQMSENGKTDSDSGCNLSSYDVQKGKPRRSSSDLTGMKSSLEFFNNDKKKNKNGKKSNLKDKGKKNRNKTIETRSVPTVSRKVQQMADGTLYLVTTVSGDTTLPGVYSDSPDTSSELSSHKPVKMSGESNC